MSPSITTDSPTLGAFRGAFGSREELNDVRQHLRGDAEARVPDAQHDRTSLPGGRQEDVPARLLKISFASIIVHGARRCAPNAESWAESHRPNRPAAAGRSPG
jgi:hypothetical protein